MKNKNKRTYVQILLNHLLCIRLHRAHYSYSHRCGMDEYNIHNNDGSTCGGYCEWIVYIEPWPCPPHERHVHECVQQVCGGHAMPCIRKEGPNRLLNNCLIYDCRRKQAEELMRRGADHKSIRLLWTHQQCVWLALNWILATTVCFVRFGARDCDASGMQVRSRNSSEGRMDCDNPHLNFIAQRRNA